MTEVVQGFSPGHGLHGRFKLGRKPRTFDPRIPHLSSIFAAVSQPPPPDNIDYLASMNPNFGMMLNDRLGDCTCAAYYHAVQVWSYNCSQQEITEPDRDVLALYEAACGYNPHNPDSDQGGVEQDVLKYLYKRGAPWGPNGRVRHKILGFVEVDPRNHDDVKRTIYDCGGTYIGFDVPANIMPDNANPPKLWDVDPSTPQILGGHAVFCSGYDAEKVRLVSWGEGDYWMTWAFWDKYVSESYALADPTWFSSNSGKTLLGMSTQELLQLMQGL